MSNSTFLPAALSPPKQSLLLSAPSSTLLSPSPTPTDRPLLPKSPPSVRPPPTTESRALSKSPELASEQIPPLSLCSWPTPPERSISCPSFPSTTPTSKLVCRAVGRVPTLLRSTFPPSVIPSPPSTTPINSAIPLPYLPFYP